MASVSVSDLNYHRRLVEQAAEQGRRAVGYLYRADGTPRFSPEEQKESIAAALAPLWAAVENAQEVAEMAMAEAKRRATAANADPLSKLGTEELQRYTLLRPLVAETVAELSPAQLVGRLESVRDHSDGLTKLAYLDAMNHFDAMPGRVNEDMAPYLPARLEMEKSLQDPGAAKAISDAAELRKAAHDLDYWAGDVWGDVSGAKAEADAQRVAAYGGKF